MRLRNFFLKDAPKFKSFKSFCTKSSSNNGEINFPNRSIEYFINPNKFIYIDKTKDFEKMLSNTNTEIFYQPDAFGKTFNLDMFRYFISDVNKVDNSIDKGKRNEFFQKTEIFKNKEIVEKHFSKHPVIYLNFKELDEKNFQDNIEKLKLLLNSQIEQIFQYESVKSLNGYELKIFEEFINNLSNNNTQFLTNIPKELSRILTKLSQNNTFILINNYDYPLIRSYGKKCYEEFKPFLESFMKNTFKNNNYIYKGILTGVNELEHNQIFSNINNLKVYSFKDNKDQEANKLFGISVSEDIISGKNQNLKIYENNISAYNNFKNLNKNISFFNFNKTYNKENLSSFNEDNLIKHFNIESISEYLNLTSLFANMVNDSSFDYLSGYKILNLLNNKAENYLNNFYNSTNLTSNTFSDENITLDLEENKFFSLTNPLKKLSLISYLLSNNIIQLNKENNIEIPNIISALLIRHSFSKLKYHLEDYDRKLAFNFYRYLYFNKTQEYFQEIKSIFDASIKSTGVNSKKITPFSKPINLIFKSEKELENYFIHIMTLELNLEDSKENINIYQIQDDENTQISDLLKEFTLITFDDRKFAIFARFNKFKLTSAAEELNEIDEVEKNDIIKKSKKKIPKVNTKDIIKNLQSINEEKVLKIDKDEAVKFLSNIPIKFESVSFVSLANYKNYLEYSIQSFQINKE